MIGDVLAPTHLLLILLVALLVLGPKRLPEVGRSLGKGLRDFRDAMSNYSPDALLNADESPAAAPLPTAATATPAPAAPEPPVDAAVANPAAAEPAVTAPVANPAAAEPAVT